MTNQSYDFHYFSKVIKGADLNTWLATAISLVALGGIVSGKLGQKDLGYILTGVGVGATLVAKTANKTAEDTRLIMNDFEDISAQVRTNVTFKSLQESNVTITEVNWELLAGSRLPVCIRGDRPESLKVAEWLAQKMKGMSLFVSDTIEDIRVSQCISPGIEANVVPIDEVLNYQTQPDYPSIIGCFDLELGRRKTSDRASAINELWDLVVILDSPTVSPQTNHCVALGMTYVVMGKSFDGWQDILVGTAATEYAMQRKDLPYWKVIIERWDTGEFPVLVNNKYARLPSL